MKASGSDGKLRGGGGEKSDDLGEGEEGWRGDEVGNSAEEREMG